MPAIRKIRIVNFRFNDGAKLIPDEIFCTENSEGKPIDTLLNLDNGGGKSVIVQLMLQPVCPKAKVQNRSISDYFQKGTDHAFVLIEWALDGSSNSLLTGIALAASTTADDETESRSVRYYTFINDYAKTGDRSDIVNLPLTERKGSRIRPLSYDELRKYLQSRKIDYYPSDSLRRYHKRLEEYGILHTEWENLLVRINSVEGGIEKFFEEYKTADRLLDRFIIPGVMPDDKRSSEELEEMFEKYAVSYAGQEENLRIQSQIKAFTVKSEGIIPLIKDMWNAENARINSIQALFDHLYTLEHNIRLETTTKDQLEGTIAGLRAKLHHIKAEKASEAYYLSKEQYDEAEDRLEECTKTKESAENRRNSLSHTLNVLNAAKEYEELIGQQDTEKALLAKIRELENGTQDSRILSLKYSLSVKTAGLMQQTDKALELEKNTRGSLTETLSEIRETILQLEKQHSDKNNSLNQIIGQRKYLSDQISKRLSALSLHITVMLDGDYSREDKENIRSGYDKQLGLADEQFSRYLNEEDKLRQELDSQDNRRTELARSQANCILHLEQEKAALKKYREDYNKVITVLEHLSIPADRLFSDEPITALDDILGRLREQLKKAERSAEMLTEQIRCIQAGHLHLSDKVVSFLLRSGVSYQTGEQYLNYQSPRVREIILSADPLAAYSVIVNNEKEKSKLLSQSVDIWFPSVVPVYTRSEIADMADGKWNEENRFLSSYDKEFFCDAAAYSQHIGSRLDDAKKEVGELRHQIGEWETEREISSHFGYTADDEQLILEKVNSFENKQKKIQEELSELDRRKSEIRMRTEELRRLREKQQKLIHTIEKNKEDFEQVCGMIYQCETLTHEISEMRSSCGALSRKIDSEKNEEKTISERIAQCDNRTDHLNEKTKEYLEILKEIGETSKAELIMEDYSSILAEYRLYQESYSADRQKLQGQLKRIHNSIIKKEKDIQRFHIEPTEYQAAEFSDKAYSYTEEQLDRAKKEFDQAYKKYDDALKNHTEAGSALKQAQERLDELHTELLPRTEVGSDHERRISECEAALSDVGEQLDRCKNHLAGLETDHRYTASLAKPYTADAAGYTPHLTDGQQDTNKIRETIETCKERLHQAEIRTKEYHQRELEPFRSEYSSFAGTLDGILSVINNHNIAGDKYYTLYERTEDDIKRYRDRIAQLSIILEDVENSRKQLVANCLQRVGRLYENLTMLSKKSTIQIGNVKRQMIRIDLPEIDPSSELSAERINKYITDQVRSYLSEKESSVRQNRSRLELRRLLNCYIGQESIPVTVFKIDKNIHNSRYRSWQDAIKANSGGEQFVVLFSLIVSVMNYTRSLTSSLIDSSGVLILDNPFGPITSAHLLEPMFSIARHFHIQLICLTHIGTAAVTGFFDMVYQLRFRSLPLSNKEILQSEAKQHIEHAYYLSEQLSLF